MVTESDVNDVAMVSLLLNLSKFHKLFWCYHYFVFKKSRLGSVLISEKLKAELKSHRFDSY